jgi:outer membrane protein
MGVPIHPAVPSRSMHCLPLARRRSALLAAIAFTCATPGARADGVDASEAPTYAFGAGVERIPGWPGSKTHRYQPVPYIDIEIPGYGELSTLDGLTVDLIHGEKFHGGIYADYLWGRESGDLGPLRGKLNALSPRIQAGGYLEYEINKSWTVGSHLAHDTQGAGAYDAFYVDWKLPKVWYIEHSLEVQWQGMNAAAMGRFFGVTPPQSQALGIAPWNPGGGGQLAYIEYDAFIPTSQHTGFALSLNAGRLIGGAADSPLVRRYGSRNQITQALAFVYHF